MSSQVDSRSQSAGKRARTDGSRREDDWVCPSCKNVNFAFRTTCNMRNCNQSRPADHTAMQKPMQTPPHYATSGGYMGPGTPPSMYLGGGASPYGSSMFNGPAMARYGIHQFPGSSAYPYGYGGRIPMGSPYGPMQIAGPPPYSGGSMMGAGGMYGMPMDRYGLIPAGPGAMGTRAGSYSDEGSQKKPAGAGRDNDWECPNCRNINFAFRTVCNMRKCNTPRPENQGSKPDGSRVLRPMPDGSWKCEQCNNINYPFRTKCNRPQCGAEKPSQTNNTNDSVTDQDNQVCVSEPSVWSSTFATPLFRTLLSCTPYDILKLFLIIFVPSCLLAHSLIYHVLTVTVSPRTVMRVKKVQRHRQGSV